MSLQPHLFHRIFPLSLAMIICTFIITAPSFPEETKLIIRGDDLGMTQGTLEAFEKAFNNGVLTCASIIVPGAWFEGTAELCRKNPAQKGCYTDQLQGSVGI